MSEPVLPTSGFTQPEASANGEVMPAPSVEETSRALARQEPVGKPSVETRDRVRRLLVGVTATERAKMERCAEVAICFRLSPICRAPPKDAQQIRLLRHQRALQGLGRSWAVRWSAQAVAGREAKSAQLGCLC